MTATASAMNKAGDATVDAAITGKVKAEVLADRRREGPVDRRRHQGRRRHPDRLEADKAGNADKAVSIAKATDGVKSVDNKLTVKP